MKSIALIIWIFAFTITGFGFFAFCSLLIPGLYDSKVGIAMGTDRLIFALSGMIITGLFGTALVRKTIILVVVSALLNTLFIIAIAWVTFGSANVIEGPEAAGRGIAAIILLPFLIVEAGMLFSIRRPVKLKKPEPKRCLHLEHKRGETVTIAKSSLCPHWPTVCSFCAR